MKRVAAAPWPAFVRVAVGVSIAAPAWATTQCPDATSQGSGAVNWLAWGAAVLVWAAGSAAAYLVIKRTRGWRRRQRLPALLLGALAMLSIWLAGLVLVLRFFVLPC